MVSINVHRLWPETEAIEGVRNILSPDFSPSAFESAIAALTTRTLYPPASSALMRYVRAERGDSSLVATLVDPLLTQNVRARRTAREIRLFKRNGVDAFGFSFGFADLVAATKTAPLARLALACLGFVLDPEGEAIPYTFGEPWPDTRRERAALALHFLTGQAFELKRGAR